MRTEDFGLVQVAGVELAAQRLYDRAAPAMAEALNREITPIVPAAADAWPVKTGNSRGDLFQRVAAQDEGTISLELGNTALYSGIIHSGDTARDLLFVPIREGAERTAATVARIIGGD